MNSNSLFQQIHQLDLNIKSFSHSLEELQEIGSGVLETPFEKLNAVL